MRPNNLFVAFWLMGIMITPMAETTIGKVVGVSDGDTITVLDANREQHKIRLIGIDAPEKKQDFGNRSKQNLSDLVYGKTVSVDLGKTDRYGRTLSKVLVDGKDVALSQVKAGLAWHYKAYEKDQSPTDRQAYADAESVARSKHIGLWASRRPTSPWDYRHGSAPVASPVEPAPAASPKNTAHSSGTCPCSDHVTCTGPRGGHFCMTSGGKKRYL